MKMDFRRKCVSILPMAVTDPREKLEVTFSHSECVGSVVTSNYFLGKCVSVLLMIAATDPRENGSDFLTFSNRMYEPYSDLLIIF